MIEQEITKIISVNRHWEDGIVYYWVEFKDMNKEPQWITENQIGSQFKSLIYMY